jgi:hypothetical protein
MGLLLLFYLTEGRDEYVQILQLYIMKCILFTKKALTDDLSL